jgi:transposase
MPTREDDMEVHALGKRGWSIPAIARHTGHDRKTVRKYLAGDQTRPVCGPDRHRTRSTRSWTTSPRGWSRTRQVMKHNGTG